MGLSFRSLAIRNGSIWTGFHSGLEYRAWGKKLNKAQLLSRITAVSFFQNSPQLAVFSWQNSLGRAPKRVERVDCADRKKRGDRKERADRKGRADRADRNGRADRKKSAEHRSYTYLPLQTPHVFTWHSGSDVPTICSLHLWDLLRFYYSTIFHPQQVREACNNNKKLH